VSVWPPPLQQPHPPIWGAASRSPDTFRWIGREGFGLLTVVYLHTLEQLAALVAHYHAGLAEAGHAPSEVHAAAGHAPSEVLTASGPAPAGGLVAGGAAPADGRAASGPAPAGPPIATHYQVYCAEDAREARRVGEQALRSYVTLSNSARALGHVPVTLNPDEIQIERLIDEARVCIGTPDECAAILERAAATLGLTSIDCTFIFGDLDYERAHRSLTLFAREVMPRFRARPVAAPASA
jgi:alkanesulfonate monooxygenase SsuD/methylene tetrahydromethanopterin reductase-like flavin-dependent oxidoreductase (luciferase family)